jgi:excisionase family DNA binding protein
MSNRLLTAQQLAEHCQVSVGTIRLWVKEGVIPSLKGLRRLRFNLNEVDEALRQRGQPASATAGSPGGVE